MELPPPVSKNQVQHTFHLSTKILFDTMSYTWRQFLTLSDANIEARPTGMKISPITVNIEMAWKKISG